MLEDIFLFFERIYRFLRINQLIAICKQNAFRILFNIAPILIKSYPGYDILLEKHKQRQIYKIPNLETDRSIKLRRYKQLNLDESDLKKNQQRFILFISHPVQGGIKKHVAELQLRLQDENINILCMYINTFESIRLDIKSDKFLDSLYFTKKELPKALFSCLRQFNLIGIHIHTLYKYPDWLIYIIQEMKCFFKIPVYLTIHDYAFICPRTVLFNPSTLSYCGEPFESSACNSCIKLNNSPYGSHINIDDWRSRSSKILEMSDFILCPSNSVVQRMQRYYPGFRYIVREHPENLRNLQLHNTIPSDGIITVVTIGALTSIKGSHIFYECAKYADQHKLPLRFALIGYSYIDHKLKKISNVAVTGKYCIDTLNDNIEKLNPSLAFLPSISPETYSYTLSEAWLNGLYVVAFDIGAISERISNNKSLGELIPYEKCRDPAYITKTLLSAAPKSLSGGEIKNSFTIYSSILNDYYPSL